MSSWIITSWALKHPVHGSFHITLSGALKAFTVQRSWHPGPGLTECEFVGRGVGAFQTLEAAQSAAAARIAELDVEAARRASATPLCCSAPTDATSTTTEGL